MAVERNPLSQRKRKLLELLETPIKFGRIPEGERDAFVHAETEKRIAAAFDFYDIEPATPQEAKWMALAIYLLGAHFRGCRSLQRQPGGAPKTSQGDISAVVTAFDEYCRTARPASKTAHATNFLKARSGEIPLGKKTITTPKAFLNLYRREKKAAS